MNEEKLNYQNFRNLHHIKTVESFVLDIYRSVFDVLNGQVRRYSGVINRCIEYIHVHYIENIALSDAAYAVNVSKSYLSLLFKQETGINFSKFLMNYRIEEAKKLLSETNMHIYEVAERVGFPNPYYFSKIFKEATGFTCKEFKNLGPQLPKFV
jgi:two-component system response regulator YesN